jgi:hypothetical protein
MATELQITRVADRWRGRTRAHMIFLRIDWCSSRSLKLDPEAGSTARLSRGPRGTATGLYGITVGFRH